MELRIGELARQAGLTVRTLRHYDAIGLLTAAKRTEGGYRLYGKDDVMRLHAILALKAFGCSLAAIREVFSRGGVVLPQLLSRQIKALEAKERQARELRETLCRVRGRLERNETTTLDDWLDILGKMLMYGKYFSGEQLVALRSGAGGGDGLRDAWRELAARVREAMERGVSPTSGEAAALVRPMVALARQLTGGDAVLLARIREMLDREERARQNAGLTAEGLAWIDQAVASLREAASPVLAGEPAATEAPDRSVPSGTALAVATLRAAHQLLDASPVFADPLALQIVGPEREAAIRKDPARFDAGHMRGLRASVAVRSRFAEDAWTAARDRGVRQCVLLGAGFDTFAYRTDDREARIFEVDHPGTQDAKKERLAAAGIAAPDNLAFVPVDLGHGPVVPALEAAGFRREAPAFFFWLGVVMYLPEAVAFRVLADVAGLAAGTEIVFDYPVDPALLTPGEQRAREAIAARAAARGEPWRSAFAPAALGERLSGLGFAVTEDLGGPELTARYLAGRPGGLVKSDLTRIVRAKVAGPAA